MPFDAAHISRPSRIMVPSYIVVEALFGAAYITDWQHRFSRAPSLSYQRGLMPLWVWGALMLGLSLTLLVARFLTHNRIAGEAALCMGVVAWFLWGCTIAAAIPGSANTTPLAPVLPWFVAVCHVASFTSLLTRSEA